MKAWVQEPAQAFWGGGDILLTDLVIFEQRGPKTTKGVEKSEPQANKGLGQTRFLDERGPRMSLHISLEMGTLKHQGCWTNEVPK